MTYLIFDLVLVALLLFFVWRGYERGFILTLCGFLAIFVAFIGASVVSHILAEPVSRSIRPIVEQQLHQFFEEHVSADVSLPEVPLPDFDFGGEAVDEALSNLEIPLQEALELLKDTRLYKGFADAFQNAVDSGMVSASADAARVIADYIARQLAQIVLFLIAFILILILWFFLSHALDLAFRLPVLSAINHWTGGFLGFFKGALLLFIACWLLKGSFIPQDAIQNTYLLNFFCTASPLAWLS